MRVRRNFVFSIFLSVLILRSFMVYLFFLYFFMFFLIFGSSSNCPCTWCRCRTRPFSSRTSLLTRRFRRIWRRSRDRIRCTCCLWRSGSWATCRCCRANRNRFVCRISDTRPGSNSGIRRSHRTRFQERRRRELCRRCIDRRRSCSRTFGLNRYRFNPICSLLCTWGKYFCCSFLNIVHFICCFMILD